jgi:hypothetical protein
LGGVVGDLGLIFGKKLIALRSLHVVSTIGLGLFGSDLFSKFVDKIEDITNHSVSSKVQL